MCCRTSYTSVIDLTTQIDEVERIFTVAGFHSTMDGVWERAFEPSIRGDQRYIRASITPYQIQFSIVPSIYTHSVEEHQQAALLASVLFQVAGVLGERFGGTVRQQSLVSVCREEGGYTRTLAVYPEEPMRHENICVGFRAVLRRGVGMVYATTA